MTERDHRNWFGFLEKLATLSREYSVDDLRWLKKEALRRYPSTVPLIEACLNLASADNRALKSETLSNEALSMKRHAEAGVETLISQTLFDTDRFPANSDIVALAKANVPNFPELRFDKMGRARTVDTVLAHVQKAPADARQRFGRAVLGDIELPEAANADSSFLSSWEKIIKGT